MQNDFIDGALGSEQAVAIVPKVIERINTFHGKIFFTRDTHEEDYLETQEGKKLPVKHCIRGTKGWEIHPDIAALCKDEPIDKATFGSLAIGIWLKEENKRNPIESITLVGLCTDICVISNAMLIKACLPEVKIIIDASCCAGVTPESHETALRAMEACQIEVINR
jgi:nicotinamidase-related amidase